MKAVPHTDPAFDLAIIGGGVAALAAAMYAGRLQLKTLLVGEKVGGTVALTDDISNYPGFKQITGLELAEKIEAHVRDYGVQIVEDKVTKVVPCSQGCLKVYCGNNHFHATTVIFATGTEWKKLEVPGEKEYAGKGVHYCALCDGVIYKDKVVAVIGGSDSAAKEALLLTQFAKKVYSICKGSGLRPEPVTLKRALGNPKIEVIHTNSVTKIQGKDFVDSVLLVNPYKGSKELDVDAVFVEVGHLPLSDLAKEMKVDLNDKKEIMVDKLTATNIPGVFAAGDVTDSMFKQAITAVAQGVTAAYSAYNYIKSANPMCMCDDDEMKEVTSR